MKCYVSIDYTDNYGVAGVIDLTNKTLEDMQKIYEAYTYKEAEFNIVGYRKEDNTDAK